MMNDMFKAYVKDLFNKVLKSGGTTLLEELCENYDADQLDQLIALLTRVRNKKRSTVDVNAKVVG